MEKSTCRNLSQYNSKISALKGVGITLMVIGHSGINPSIGHWIYMFHMPLFFFLSGYLFKDKYFDDRWSFVKNKVKGYYFPFVKWVVFFVLIHNFLADLYFLDGKYTFYEMLQAVVNAFIFINNEPATGGYWFLKGLFWASLIAFGMLLISSKLKSIFKLEKKITGFDIVMIILSVIAAWICSYTQLCFLTMPLLGCAFFLSGYVLSRYEFTPNYILGGVLLIVSVLVATFLDFDFSLLAASGKKVLFNYPNAMICIIALINLMPLIGKPATDIFAYIGRHTLVILTLHFVSFKLFTLVLIFMGEASVESLMCHPVPKNFSEWYWICYTITGIGVPLIWIETYMFIKSSIKKFFMSGFSVN